MLDTDYLYIHSCIYKRGSIFSCILPRLLFYLDNCCCGSTIENKDDRIIKFNLGVYRWCACNCQSNSCRNRSYGSCFVNPTVGFYCSIYCFCCWYMIIINGSSICFVKSFFNNFMKCYS